MTRAITGYYLGTEDGGESKFGAHKERSNSSSLKKNVVLIGHVISDVAIFFFQT